MAWSSTFPDGTQSVKANQPIGQGNTTYIETTMNNDHYWNIGANENGRHKSINMKNLASDPAAPSAGMDGVIYLKLANATAQGFFKNTRGLSIHSWIFDRDCEYWSNIWHGNRVTGQLLRTDLYG